MKEEKETPLKQGDNWNNSELQKETLLVVEKKAGKLRSCKTDLYLVAQQAYPYRLSVFIYS